MIKYRPGDDGHVVDGKTVVFLHRPAGSSPDEPVAVRGKKAAHDKQVDPARLKAAAAQAAVLTAAAKDGVPFCEECEKARKALAAR